MYTIDLEKLNSDIQSLEHQLNILYTTKQYIIQDFTAELTDIENELSEFLSQRTDNKRGSLVMNLVLQNNIRSASRHIISLSKLDGSIARKLMYKIRILKFNPKSDASMKDALRVMRDQNQLSEPENSWFKKRGW